MVQQSKNRTQNLRHTRWHKLHHKWPKSSLKCCWNFPTAAWDFNMNFYIFIQLILLCWLPKVHWVRPCRVQRQTQTWSTWHVMIRLTYARTRTCTSYRQLFQIHSAMLSGCHVALTSRTHDLLFSLVGVAGEGCFQSLMSSGQNPSEN